MELEQIIKAWRAGSVTAEEALAAIQRENLMAEALMMAIASAYETQK